MASRQNRHPKVTASLLELRERAVSEKWHLQRRQSYATSVNAKGHALQDPRQTLWWRIEDMYVREVLFWAGMQKSIQDV